MTHIESTKARDEFADTLNRVAYAGERIVLSRRGKDIAAIVPMEDLEMIRAIEDRIDLAAAKKALKEKGSIPLAKIKAELGLK